MEATPWRDRWSDQREGAGCVLCGRSSIDDDDWGTRVFTGGVLDAFVWKTGIVPGYVVAVWRARHVAEPTELAPDEAAAYWAELLHVGRAVERCFTPAKMNYETLGNNVPHLHTHIVPRPWDGDPSPNAPLSFDYLDAPRQPEAQVSESVARLRTALNA
jgi:diadenosine tetraphosphate (Ap4A) HIT family hydrolase